MKFSTWLPSMGGLTLLLPVLFSGCITTYDMQARQQAAAHENRMIEQERHDRLAGRIEGLEMELQTLARELEQLRQKMSGDTQSVNASVQGSVSGLEQRLDSLEAKRVKDREEIIQKLSEKITKLMNAQAAAAATSPATGGTGFGYEHVVKAGDTLSTIAKAYQVTMKAIIDANNITDPNNLRIGQKLVIPE